MSILCSETEGFPNSIVESLAAGVPVVATDCVSGPRELLAPGEDLEQDLALRDGIFPAAHGVLVRMGDPAALARAIEYQAGVQDAGQRAACIEFARQFDARTVTRQYCQLVAAAQ
jgi:glycosyltransferase involved in cell wall biosynthesis